MVPREQETGRATDRKSTHGFGDSQMKRLFPILAAGIMASLSIMAGIGAVHAQEKAEARFNGAVNPRRIAMGVGKSVIIDLPQDAAEIFVANPKVANAVVRSPRKLYVIGMDAGQTSVFALDQQGRQIAALELSIGRDVGELQQILRAAMPAAAITARTVNDTRQSAEKKFRALVIARGHCGGSP
jgi:pilus assembly protein CpaC